MNEYKELLNAIYGKNNMDEYFTASTSMPSKFESGYTHYERIRMEHDIRPRNPKIKNVKFNPPATIVFWTDNTKTVVKCEGEDYDPEKGLAMCICKKMLGNKGNYYEVFKKWLPKEETSEMANLLKNAFKPETWTFDLKPIDINKNLFGVLTGTNGKTTIEFKDAKEESKRNPIEEAYEKLVEHRDGDGEIDLDELIGLLGEALDS